MELTQWFESTCSEGISNITFYTSADRNMVHYSTFSIYSTCSWAGVDTLVSLTCFVRWTVGVDHTFWTTCDIWVPKILGYTLTYPLYLSSCSTTVGRDGMALMSELFKRSFSFIFRSFFKLPIKSFFLFSRPSNVCLLYTSPSPRD